MSVQSRVQHARFENAAQEAVVSLVVTAALVLQRMNDLLRKHGLTHDQYNVLRILRGAHPTGHSRLEVGKRLMSRAPDVTRLIDRLERQGLVERGWAPENRRHSIARITPAGLELLARVDPELLALQQAIVDGIPVEELQALSRTCARMAS
jgi:DNA-binding MarR family transcriptional regulator